MNWKIVALSLGVSLQLSVSYAQENLDFSGKKNLGDPILSQDSIKFNLLAPDAKSVKIQGNWIPAKGFVTTPVAMEKLPNGSWNYAIARPASDLYTYNFIVDGVRTIDPNNVYTVRDVSSVSSLLYVSGGVADYYAVHDVPHGTMAKRWYPSKGLKMDRRITIYTPSGYEASKEKLPVLYLLHGVGGDEDAWSTLGRASEILDNMIASGKVKPMIVVMPNGHTSNSAAPGESSKGFYYPEMMTPDVFNGDMEQYFPEIESFVESNYRTLNNKKSRAIAGLSMGGFHALYISANEPNMFDYVGLFSPAILPPENKKSAIYEQLNEKLALQLKNQFKLYWIGIGKDDFLHSKVVDYRQKLDSMHFPYQYTESAGAHTWSNWRQYLTEFLPLLFK